MGVVVIWAYEQTPLSGANSLLTALSVSPPHWLRYLIPPSVPLPLPTSLSFPPPLSLSSLPLSPPLPPSLSLPLSPSLPPPLSLMYAERDLSVAGMVLDSPFASLSSLIPELVEQMKIPLPKFTVVRGWGEAEGRPGKKGFKKGGEKECRQNRHGGIPHCLLA